MTQTHHGHLYGIGVGPGDPDLLSIKGLRCLQRAPIVAFPAGVAGKVGIAERIITPWLQPSQHKLPLHFPYVLDPHTLETAWQQTSETIWGHLSSGQDVAFACEGDISFYSTFNYLASTLRQHHPEVQITTIPGISSPMAAAAALGIPLTTQKDQLAILPTLHCLDHLRQVLTWADVIVLMKVSSSYAQVWPILQEQQLLQHAYVVINASTTEEIIYRDLEQHPHLKLPYFALLMIRKPGQ